MVRIPSSYFPLTCGEDRVACPRQLSSRRSAPEAGPSGANGTARVLLTRLARCAGCLWQGLNPLEAIRRGRLIVVTVSHYRTDRTPSCGRTGKQLQQSLSLVAPRRRGWYCDSNPCPGLQFVGNEGHTVEVHYDGQAPEVRGATHGAAKYVRTKPNDTKDDNLLKQPSC